MPLRLRIYIIVKGLGTRLTVKMRMSLPTLLFLQFSSNIIRRAYSTRNPLLISISCIFPAYIIKPWVKLHLYIPHPINGYAVIVLVLHLLFSQTYELLAHTHTYVCSTVQSLVNKKEWATGRVVIYDHTWESSKNITFSCIAPSTRSPIPNSSSISANIFAYKNTHTKNRRHTNVGIVIHTRLCAFSFSS